MSDEPDDEWLDEDEDEAETWCIKCHRYCWPDELEFLICKQCLNENAEGDTCQGK